MRQGIVIRLLLLFSSIFVLHLSTTTYANIEVDALYSLRTSLIDPNKVLQSWDRTLVNPCTWFHVTCNKDDSIIRVDLGNANLSGQLVPQLGQLKNLQYLRLHTNNISGPIPGELGNLNSLVSLDLYLNSLTGSIPDTLGKLERLRFLRINNNTLTGVIPMSLTNITSLQLLDLSNNRLSGSIPDNGSFSLFTPIWFANNLNLCGRAAGKPCPGELPFSPPPPFLPNEFTSSVHAGNHLFNTGAIGGMVAGAVMLFTAPAILFAWWFLQKPQKHSHHAPGDPKVLWVKKDSLGELGVAKDSFRSKNSLRGGFGRIYKWCLQNPIERFYDVADEGDPEVLLRKHQRRFSLQELQVATDGFHKKNILATGGSGKVYKGRLVDGSSVVVKRLQGEHTPHGELQFLIEVEMSSKAVHRNLLHLRGFCMAPAERLLVYPYMANGSVASWLRERPPDKAPLDWPTRMRIASGSARGLSYLHEHCNPKIVHRDVKAANILLDDEFEAIIGDFGLAKLMDFKDTHVTTAVRGTVGHIAPEYLSTGKSSEKTDVFGYGMMLLELITGQRTLNLARLADGDDFMLLDWVKRLLTERNLDMLVDPNLRGNYIESEVQQLTQIALLCSRFSPMDRPKMVDVVGMVEGECLTERWEEWQKLDVFCHKNSELIEQSTKSSDIVEILGLI